MAYGPLGLKPWEFARLTFGEFAQLAEGQHWRMREEQRMSAAFVASIINTCTTRDLKRAVTVETLLGQHPAKSPERTKGQVKAEMKALLAEVG